MVCCWLGLWNVRLGRLLLFSAICIRNSDGEVVKMYNEKRGFVMVDRFDVDLKACGIDGGLYMHVAMTKQLEAAVDEDKMGGDQL